MDNLHYTLVSTFILQMKSSDYLQSFSWNNWFSYPMKVLEGSGTGQGRGVSEEGSVTWEIHKNVPVKYIILHFRSKEKFSAGDSLVAFRVNKFATTVIRN